MSMIYSYRNTDKTPPKVVNIWSSQKRELEAVRKAKQAIGVGTVSWLQRRQIAEEVLRAKAEAHEREEHKKLKKYRPSGGFNSYARIEWAMCEIFGFTKAQIKGKRRDQAITHCRFAIAYWTYRRTALSLPQIGRLMGKDHTTILHAIRKYPVYRQALTGRYVKPLR